MVWPILLITECDPVMVKPTTISPALTRLNAFQSERFLHIYVESMFTITAQSSQSVFISGCEAVDSSLCGQHLFLDSFSFYFKISFALSSSSSFSASLCSEYSRAFYPPSPGAPALTRTWNSQVDIERTAATWPSCTRSALPPGWDFWPASQTAWPSVLCLWWRWWVAGGGGGGGGSGARWYTIQ